MKEIDVEFGAVVEYIVYSFSNVKSMTLVDIRNVEIFTIKVDKDATPPYYPEVNEMCLAFYEIEGDG